MSFSGDVSKWVAKVTVQTEVQHRSVLFEMSKRIIERSPVDTGRFRGNWQISTGPSPQATPTDELDPSGSATAARVLGELAPVKPGGIVWISNGLVYGPRLEYGWSKQAPRGIIRLTAVEFSQIVQEVR